MNSGRTFRSRERLSHRRVLKGGTAFGAVLSVLGMFAVFFPFFMDIGEPLESFGFMIYAFAVFFMAGGVIDIIFATKLRPEKGWGWLLFSGILSILVGAFITMNWPVSGSCSVGVYVGVRLLIHGWVLMVLGRKDRTSNA